MEVIETAALNKSGETYARVTLRRNRVGLLVLDVWTMPHIEEFIMGLGDGTQVDSVLGGRHWVSLGGGDTPVPLMVHQLNTVIPPIYHTVEKRLAITLSSVGVPVLTTDYNTGYETLNLGFLRLVGTSNSEGVSFGIRGIHSSEQIHKMRELIGEGLKRFYVGYMKPVNTSVMISGQTF